MAFKKCPYCAEDIQEEAIFCKHCRQHLGNDENAVESATISKPSKLRKFGWGLLGLILGSTTCNFLILVFLVPGREFSYLLNFDDFYGGLLILVLFALMDIYGVLWAMKTLKKIIKLQNEFPKAKDELSLRKLMIPVLWVLALVVIIAWFLTSYITFLKVSDFELKLVIIGLISVLTVWGLLGSAIEVYEEEQRSIS